MDSFDILGIYRRYCDIRLKIPKHYQEECYRQDDESHKGKGARDELARLLQLVDSNFHARYSIFDELSVLKSQLDFMGEYSEFSRFYDFAFFICREKGQKNITVSRAVTAWKLLLAGRFRLLNQWCDFVEKNQRHNISEDTWQQVLVFSWCVHENLAGYDPEGAWPVLIDDFVEHMYRILGPKANAKSLCSCGEWESQTNLCAGIENSHGLKRKLGDEDEEMGSSETLISPSSLKRSRLFAHREVNGEGSSATGGDAMEVAKQSGPMGSNCAVEGCLSQGFASLLSPTSSCLQFGRESRASS